jgi:hemoglobin
MRTKTRLLALAFALTACAQPPSAPPALVADGQLAAPAGYKTWRPFLANVQRPDNGQVRDIYVNDAGAKTTPGSAFANGSVFVMELYAAVANADGSYATGADGRLVRGELKKIFLMAKGEGWGATYPDAALRNGDWVYAAYLADGATPAPDDLITCRACHLPHAEKDFVHRYDEGVAALAGR